MTIRVGLLGFGRAGKSTATEIINDPELSLEWVVRRNTINKEQTASGLLGHDHLKIPLYSSADIDEDFFERNPVDILIDFSSEEGIKFYQAAGRSGAKIVSAISHYSLPAQEFLQKISMETAVLHSPNITIGINCLLVASRIMQEVVPHSDIEIIEEHFRDKKEKSGTAMKLAEGLGLDPKKHINSIRVGGIVGKHEVIFGLPTQTIRLVHESISRAAFGRGAIFAAKWIVDKKIGFYSMEKIIQEKFLNHLLPEKKSGLKKDRD